MKNDDYISGPHHFWTHFWCGLVLGAGIGAWISDGTFGGGWLAFIITLALALIAACCCGRWGESVWHWILKLLGEIT